MTKKHAKSGRSGPPRKKNAQSRKKQSGGQNRNHNNRNKNRNNDQGRRRYKKQTVPRKPKDHRTLGQKILNVLTFGLLCEAPGKKKDTRKKDSSQNKTARKTADKQKQKPRKAPERVPVTGTRLYVGNLSYTAAEADLTDLFRGAGSVQSAEVVVHRRTERSKGYAFVEMGSVEEAQRAVDILHDQDFMDRKLVVSGAKSSGRQDAA